jgi:hypothetical protein
MVRVTSLRRVVFSEAVKADFFIFHEVDRALQVYAPVGKRALGMQDGGRDNVVAVTVQADIGNRQRSDALCALQLVLGVR